MLSALVMSLGLAPTVAMAMPVDPAANLPANVARACGLPGPDQASCHALRRTDVTPHRNNPNGPNVTPSGYGPSDLQSAYNLASASAGNGGSATVAIVDAYDDPNAAADLAVYRAQYGLSTCGTGCFTKVDQTGGTNYPSGDTGWSQEISLDLDMVSAICPNCHILLVEASSNSLANLGAAVNYAASVPGVVAISNSYGAGEFSGEGNYSSSYYNHLGIAVTVSAGDSGYGVEFPAASQFVTAVGGTTLTHASNTRGWSETVWSGTGSGCSAYIAKPSWQKDTGCSRRTVGDVAADADPNTGVAVYDTYGQGGWLVFGGTSVASPIIASVYALAGNAGSVTYGSYSYTHRSSLNDVTSGSNGRCTRGRNTSQQYLCTGEPGYDGPTGNGTPNGTGGL